ncbi:MAG: AAA family ATPase [Solirubrobacterales bacterium]|nr:AAA family ATPase [Solirubrobacterales bacterium]
MRSVGGVKTGRGVFVGRQAELALVADGLAAARASDPQVIVIEGEPGIGKTAFVGQCRDRAEGFVVLEASGEESETSLDLGVVSQLMSHTPSPGGAEASQLAAGGRSSASPFVVGAQVLAVVGSLQDEGPVLIVLDDAHWIDAASAGALLFALRRLCADRVCVLIATRPEGAQAAGAGWARFLSDAERVRRIRLAGLNRREVRLLANSLVDKPLSTVAAERLREHTRGHPLYLRALVSELPAESLGLEHGTLPAPHSFAATVLARLARLSPAAQDLAAAAAVAGARCTVALAAAVAELDNALDALDEALAADLLELLRGRVPAEVSFSHPLAQAAIYDDLPLSRRRALHLAVAKLSSGTTSLAHRVAASTDADDELATELGATGYAEVMEDKLMAGIDHLLLAFRVAATRQLGERFLLRAVDALGVAGEVPRLQGLRDAIASCSDSPGRSFALACLTASAYNLEQAIEELMAVTERRDFGDDPELSARVTSSLAIICAYAGRGFDAIEWAQRALEDPLATATVELTARQGLALGLAACGRERDAVAKLDSHSTSRIAPKPFDAELIATRGGIKAQAGDFHGAVDDLDAVIRWSRVGALARSLPSAYSSLAEAEYRLGRWEEGAAHADLAVSLAEDSGQEWQLPVAHAMASLFYTGRGEWELATGHIDVGHRLAEHAPFSLNLFYVGVARAHLACTRDDPEGALDALRSLWETLPQDVAGAFRRRTYELEAEALLQAGRLSEAARLLVEIGQDRIEGPDNVGTVDAWRLRGALEHARGNTVKARNAFLRADAAAKSVGSSLSEGKLGLTYGHLLRKTGRRRAAASRLQFARERFERLRAQPFVRRCDAELSACGVRIRSDGAADLRLSPREQAVATLVAAGKSNREAGAELYLTPKAIEYHLRNIFVKLGIRSRHELASRLTGDHLRQTHPAEA